MKFTEHNSILTLSADVGEVRVHDFQQRSMHGNATAASLSRRVKEDLLKRAFVVLKARAAKNCTKAPEARGGFEARNKAVAATLLAICFEACTTNNCMKSQKDRSAWTAWTQPTYRFIPWKLAMMARHFASCMSLLDEPTARMESLVLWWPIS
ncbi:unnamed protein product [Durusdinium trenchii]|uniref:Uncharacterized protein n=1 Tax=Durusdinium trenchii TaxID=1381693 RepID=A0ABP0S4W0_9DINO